VQNLSRLREATEGADFPKLDHVPVGVAGGGVAKISISLVCRICICHAPFGVMPEQTTELVFVCILYTLCRPIYTVSQKKHFCLSSAIAWSNTLRF